MTMEERIKDAEHQARQYRNYIPRMAEYWERVAHHERLAYKHMSIHDYNPRLAACYTRLADEMRRKTRLNES